MLLPFSVPCSSISAGLFLVLDLPVEATAKDLEMVTKICFTFPVRISFFYLYSYSDMHIILARTLHVDHYNFRTCLSKSTSRWVEKKPSHRYLLYHHCPVETIIPIGTSRLSESARLNL